MTLAPGIRVWCRCAWGKVASHQRLSSSNTPGCIPRPLYPRSQYDPQHYHPLILTHMYFTSFLSDLIWVTKSPLETMKILTSFQPTLNQKSSDSMGILLLPNPFSWHCRSCFCLSPPNCVCVYLAWLHQASATCVGKGIFGQMVREKSRTVIARSNLCSNP